MPSITIPDALRPHRPPKSVPSIAAGGGVQDFSRNRRASVSQPLERIVLLTHTHEVKGLGSVGRSSRAAVSKRAPVRLEFRRLHHSLPAPNHRPAANGKISGLLHDIVFMGGIAITF